MFFSGFLNEKNVQKNSFLKILIFGNTINVFPDTFG